MESLMGNIEAEVSLFTKAWKHHPFIPMNYTGLRFRSFFPHRWISN